ncbi:hypothetical protein D3C72_2005390 [compost metagenome]
MADNRRGIFCMAHIDQHAVELRLALLVRHRFQRLQQLFQILLVGGVYARIARRVNARRAAQRIDRQPGIIRDSRKASDLCRMTRFQNRIFDKRQAGLFRGLDAQFGLCDHIQTKII